MTIRTDRELDEQVARLRWLRMAKAGATRGIRVAAPPGGWPNGDLGANARQTRIIAISEPTGGGRINNPQSPRGIRFAPPPRAAVVALAPPPLAPPRRSPPPIPPASAEDRPGARGRERAMAKIAACLDRLRRDQRRNPAPRRT